MNKLNKGSNCDFYLWWDRNCRSVFPPYTWLIYIFPSPIGVIFVSRQHNNNALFSLVVLTPKEFLLSSKDEWNSIGRGQDGTKVSSVLVGGSGVRTHEGSIVGFTTRRGRHPILLIWSRVLYGLICPPCIFLALCRG